MRVSTMEESVCRTETGPLVARILARLKLERRWVLFQCGKILVHSGFGSWSEFCKPMSSIDTPTTPLFRQTTSVFSYFVVRAALLWDVDWFASSFANLYRAYSAQHRGLRNTRLRLCLQTGSQTAAGAHCTRRDHGCE